jgi:hypothetical protein
MSTCVLAATSTRDVFMAASPANRKRDVLKAMPTIRWLLARHGFQMDPYSDEAIADALITTCPTPSDFWLRSEHLNVAVKFVGSVPTKKIGTWKRPSP